MLLIDYVTGYTGKHRKEAIIKSRKKKQVLGKNHGHTTTSYSAKNIYIGTTNVSFEYEFNEKKKSCRRSGNDWLYWRANLLFVMDKGGH